MSTTKREPLLSDERIYDKRRKSFRYSIYEVRDIYEAARAKDAEEIAKWKGIVNGVRDALNHIGAEPPRNLDADLYYTVMALRGRDAEMVQMLVRYLFRAMAAISDGDSLDCWHALRDALAAAGYKRTSP